jgi:archaea-specific DNA-binding protein
MTEKQEHKPEHRPAREDRGPREEQRPRGQIPPDTVFIGKKPLMAYATAVMMHFNSGSKRLTVKARGKSISHAVDVVEVVRRRFFEGKLSIKEVKIASEVLGEEGETRNVSTIEIMLERAD